MLLATLVQTEYRRSAFGRAHQFEPGLPATLAEAVVLGGLSCPDHVHTCLDALRPAVSSIHTLRTTLPADQMPVYRANQSELWSGPCGLLHQLDQCPPCRLHVPWQALCARGVWQAGGMPTCHSTHFRSMHCPLQLGQCSQLLAYSGFCVSSEACCTLWAHRTMCRAYLQCGPSQRCTCRPADHLSQHHPDHPLPRPCVCCSVQQFCLLSEIQWPLQRFAWRLSVSGARLGVLLSHHELSGRFATSCLSMPVFCLSEHNPFRPL